MKNKAIKIFGFGAIVLFVMMALSPAITVEAAAPATIVTKKYIAKSLPEAQAIQKDLFDRGFFKVDIEKVENGFIVTGYLIRR